MGSKPTPPSMHVVYVLKRNRSWYIGYTNNLVCRLAQHRKDFLVQLCYFEAYATEKLARLRERKLKQYGSAWRSVRQRITA